MSFILFIHEIAMSASSSSIRSTLLFQSGNKFLKIVTEMDKILLLLKAAF